MKDVSRVSPQPTASEVIKSQVSCHSQAAPIPMSARPEASAFGRVLRDWQHKRGLSQLDLALAADRSQWHISLLESGRALPSRDMVLRLATVLDVPLREQNVPLVAAGLPPSIWGEATRKLNNPGR